MISFKRIRALLQYGFVSALLAVWLPVAGADEEFLGPFASWKNVKRDFGAVGDGKADDTAALQKGLSALVNENGTAVALYVPRGTYRITSTLQVPRNSGREAIGLNVQGEDPDNTVIRWDGPAKGVILEWNAWYSRLGRITFDGAKKAESGITQFKHFVTGNELADLVFRDLAFGIRAGLNQGVGIAETSVLRCRFMRCSEAGYSSEDWNTLDWWFRWCVFQDCRRGVTNSLGSGNFHCYECVFRRSTEADIAIGHTGYFSFRHNRSTKSKTFLAAGFTQSGCQQTFQGNTIVDTVDATAIAVGNRGPVILLDNTILSRVGAAGPAVTGGQSAAVSVGNRFTVSAPMNFPGGRSIDDRTMSRPTAAPAEPTLPARPERSTAKVFEVAQGADGVAVQAAIDAAVASKTARPIVHLPAAIIPVRQTITVPAGCDIRLVGEGIPYVTRLEWVGEGAGPILQVNGPSQAEIGDFALIGGDKAVVGLAIDGIDQAGSRVLCDQSLTTGAKGYGWQIEGVQKAFVAMCDIGHSDCGVGVRVAGGPGSVVILSGASSNNDISYEIADGARLLARDIWYETNTKPRFIRFTGKLAGDFTLHGANVAHPRKAGDPGWEIDGFRGRVSLLGVALSQVGSDKDTPAMNIRGELARVALLGCIGTGSYLSADSRAVRLASNQVGAEGVGDWAADVNAKQASDDYLREMLAQAREPHRLLAFRKPPAGATDLRLHRVFVRGGRDGIVVSGGK